MVIREMIRIASKEIIGRCEGDFCRTLVNSFKKDVLQLFVQNGKRYHPRGDGGVNTGGQGQSSL